MKRWGWRMAVPTVLAALTALTAGAVDFSWELYRQLAKEKGNLFFSPYSIGTATAMAAEGAAGETKTQLDQLLGDDAGRYRQLSQQLLQMPRIEFLIANSMWPQTGFPLRPEFVTALQREYNAALFPVDYIGRLEEATRTINDWVAKQTQDRISDLLKPGALDDMTRLVLVNAIYFKAAWGKQFRPEKTSEGVFHGAETTVTCPFMHETSDWRYAETETVRLLELPYQNSAVTMWILLPQSGHALSEVESVVDAEWLQDLKGRLTPREIELALPKFKARQSFELAPVLAKLGAPLAFSISADFSGISSAPLYISNVIHQAEIEVDENGTIASAATAAVMVLRGLMKPEPPIEFIADRPFLYLIRDNKSGAVLFAGRLEQL